MDSARPPFVRYLVCLSVCGCPRDENSTGSPRFPAVKFWLPCKFPLSGPDFGAAIVPDAHVQTFRRSSPIVCRTCAENYESSGVRRPDLHNQFRRLSGPRRTFYIPDTNGQIFVDAVASHLAASFAMLPPRQDATANLLPGGFWRWTLEFLTPNFRRRASHRPKVVFSVHRVANRAGNPQLFVPADVTILNLAMNRGAINFGVFPARNR